MRTATVSSTSRIFTSQRLSTAYLAEFIPAVRVSHRFPKINNNVCLSCWQKRWVEFDSDFLGISKKKRPARKYKNRLDWILLASGASEWRDAEAVSFESQPIVLRELKRNIEYSENETINALPPSLHEKINVKALDAENPDGARAAGRELDNLKAARASKTLRACWIFVREVLVADKSLEWRLYLALVLMFLSKLLNIVVPFILKLAVDSLTKSFQSSMSSTRSVSLVMWLLIGHGIARISAIGTHELRNALFARVGLGVGRRITRAAFAYLHSLDLSFHNNSRTGATTRIVDRGTKSITMILRALIFSFVPSLFELGLVCSILSFRFTWHLAAVTILCFLLYVWYTVHINNQMARVRRLMNAVDNEGSAKLSESLFSAETVKIFNNEDFELLRYDICLSAFEEASVFNEKLLASLNAGQGAIFCVGLSVALVLSCSLCFRGLLSVGDVMMVHTMLQQLWVPLNFIGWQYRELKQSLIDMENLLELFNRRPKISDKEDAHDIVLQGGTVTFENVSFAYPLENSTVQETRPLLKNISFSVPSGKTLAIVGESGSGKSTSLRLLYRLYEPTNGRIMVDDQDIRQISQKSLRSCIGMIPQDTLLFNDTIYFNIAYGKIDSTREQVEQAAKLAQIHDTIMKMPDGYQTVVGERGARLSGGERQRVAIARCLLKNPTILLCDEATSALDSKTEQEITQALKQLGQNRTCIVVAHRLSTVVDADEILVLREGQIVERGTHMELLEDPDSAYAHMWSRQLRDKEMPNSTETCEEHEYSYSRNGYYSKCEEKNLWNSEMNGNQNKSPSTDHYRNIGYQGDHSVQSTDETHISENNNR
ncbi:ABC transporter, subfamily B, ATP-binding & transmembrane domain [Galdieria sulphuraria]|uniref:Probable ATP-dependent transporter ycf16 n=1 Tax=Galdieria sulphuraria TaxID=130081 RepID=M2XD51_GALSU|nr:ABC transporter, subfamily B, ATP-binding & transmembrane domain [Galdieria sulphuraria]EME27877.1 ABC transporter, subfamily B, ATP-binding & transmembrane domain [Galdieria sulphuraria]|eukprot:XP_005704397.1 ABC transporter, subfamily B, ATP-binding & transmembrane domain [Galdieria sulphuraria]